MGVTAGGNDCMPGSQGGFGKVDSHATTRAGNHPNFLATRNVSFFHAALRTRATDEKKDGPQRPHAVDANSTTSC